MHKQKNRSRENVFQDVFDFELFFKCNNYITL